MKKQSKKVPKTLASPKGMITYLLLIVFALVMVLPFFWLVTSSFKAPDDIFGVSMK